jgi:hypothetical protein
VRPSVAVSARGLESVLQVIVCGLRHTGQVTAWAGMMLLSLVRVIGLDGLDANVPCRDGAVSGGIQ